MNVVDILLQGQQAIGKQVGIIKNQQRSVYDKVTYLENISDKAVVTQEQINAKIKQLESRLDAITNIQDMPSAVGAVRDIQEISLCMLQEVDRICKKYELQYWLDFGTLLGAVRHRAYIPWDDDTDISMLSEDYYKFIEVANVELKNTDFRVIHIPSQICKIVHKDFMPQGKGDLVEFAHWRIEDRLCFALDIFPYYVSPDNIEETALHDLIGGQIAQTSKQIDKSNNYENFIKADKSNRAFYEKITNSKTRSDNIFLGVETRVYQPRIVKVSDIFPLKMVQFENQPFPIPRNEIKYLINLYGDYMRMPSDMHKHLKLNKIPKNDLIRLKEVKGNG